MDDEKYHPTALERRHPLIVERKRREHQAALADERYRNGDCTACGFRLDDVSLASGYERCGECDG